MKSAVIGVNSKGTGMSDALAMTEKLGVEGGLERKQVLHLRLLAEELFGTLRSIAGDIRADYWLEAERKSYEMHMKSEIDLTEDMKKQLLTVATSGKNDAARGFMGRLKVMIAEFMLSTKEVMPYAMADAASAYPMVGFAGESAAVWSMVYYKDEIQKHVHKSKEASEAWDELEKSIVANIADDVKVKIVGSKVEIVVYKAF
ncbi:MAG: hypothetical protein KIG36_06325 [Eubacteriales bacterium]|nr:hypothetical protein [Eubacteriales bacterium]